MDAGAVIAVGCWGLAACVAGLAAYGIWCDPVKPWLEEHRWRRDEHRAERRLERSRVSAGCRPQPKVTLAEHVDRQPPARFIPFSEEGLEFERQLLTGDRSHFPFARWLEAWPVTEYDEPTATGWWS